MNTITPGLDPAARAALFRQCHLCRARLAVAVAAVTLLAACGGGGSLTEPVNDSFGPGNPSACPSSKLSDAWLNNRLDCLRAGQKFIGTSGASGEKADRAYIFGQQVLDPAFNSVLGANVIRYFKHALCVRNAPANLSAVTLTGDLGTALGLNVLVTGSRYLPSGVSGSTFQYGGIADTNTLQTPCDPSRHPVIVDYDSGRIQSVNPAALAVLQVFDR
jgi:hypothetical protein